MKTVIHYPLDGLGLTLILLPPLASASDDKMYPGALCQPSSITNLIVRNASGSMFNTSSSDNQSWTCPIVRDTYAAGSVEYAQVVVIDNTPDSEVTCTLYSRTPTGAFQDSESRTTSGAPGVATLKFGDGDANAVTSVAGGYYYFDCRIPRTNNGNRSGVVSYRVTEQ